MRTEATIDGMKREIHHVLDHMRSDLDRIEILLGALSGFSRPVPDYEPGFRHLRQFTAAARELGPRSGGNR
jgi:hypothetical protein